MEALVVELVELQVIHQVMLAAQQLHRLLKDLMVAHLPDRVAVKQMVVVAVGLGQLAHQVPLVLAALAASGHYHQYQEMQYFTLAEVAEVGHQASWVAQVALAAVEEVAQEVGVLDQQVTQILAEVAEVDQDLMAQVLPEALA
jgi:hypothetical protein